MLFFLSLDTNAMEDDTDATSLNTRPLKLAEVTPNRLLNHSLAIQFADRHFLHKPSIRTFSRQDMLMICANANLSFAQRREDCNTFLFFIKPKEKGGFFLFLTHHNASLSPFHPIMAILERASRIYTEHSLETFENIMGDNQIKFLNFVRGQCRSTPDGIDKTIRHYAETYQKAGALTTNTELQSILDRTCGFNPAHRKQQTTTHFNNRARRPIKSLYLSGDFENFCIEAVRVFKQKPQLEFFVNELNELWGQKMLGSFGSSVFCIGAGHYQILDFLQKRGCEIWSMQTRSNPRYHFQH